MKEVFDKYDHIRGLPKQDLYAIRHLKSGTFKKTGQTNQLKGTEGCTLYALKTIRRMMPSYDPKSFWPREMDDFWKTWEIIRVPWHNRNEEQIVIYTDKVTFYKDHPLINLTIDRAIRESFKDICPHCGNHNQ